MFLIQRTMMKRLFLLIFSTAILFANMPYPELYSQLGTPLYKADNNFSKLPKKDSYSSYINEYHVKQAQALQTYSSGDKKAYFKALRSLNKLHDTIISLVKREMINAIKNDDPDEFISLCNAGLDILYKQESFKRLSYEYYLKNRGQVASSYLDNKMRSEQGYQKLYNADRSNITNPLSMASNKSEPQKKVVLLSRPECGWCQKTKEFLKDKHISYTDYNVISSSKGKKLFRKHEGKGVPLIIIGDKVIRGFDEASILGAL